MIRKRFLYILLALIVVALLGMLGMIPRPIIVLLYLAFSWMGYLWRVVPQVQMSAAGVATAAVCLIGMIVLAHSICAWLWSSRGSSSGWRMRWTMGGLLMLMLAFVAGLSAVGATHETVWLARSDGPMFMSSSGRLVDRVRCASNMRQIGQGLMLYAREHNGRLPDNLAELAANQDFTSDVFVCPASLTERAHADPNGQFANRLLPDHCDYVYHGRGLSWPAPNGFPLLCEALRNHDVEGLHILTGDGQVDFVSPAQAIEIMREIRQPSTRPAH